MSTPAPIQPQQLPQLALKAEIKCIFPDCGEQFVADIPRPRFMNTWDVSTISFAHQRLEKCPKCGNRYVFQILGFEPSGLMIFQFTLLPAPNQNSLIPGTQTNLKDAIDIHTLASKTKQ